MTNSRHFRILAGGDIEPLENYQEHLVLDDDSPDDWNKASAAMHTHNDRVTAILKEKGLL